MEDVHPEIKVWPVVLDDKYQKPGHRAWRIDHIGRCSASPLNIRWQRKGDGWQGSLESSVYNRGSGETGNERGFVLGFEGPWEGNDPTPHQMRALTPESSVELDWLLEEATGRLFQILPSPKNSSNGGRRGVPVDWNHLGRIDISHPDGWKLHINNRYCDFSPEETELLLGEFQDDLLRLIISGSSIVRASRLTGREAILHYEWFGEVEKFIKAMEELMPRLRAELREKRAPRRPGQALVDRHLIIDRIRRPMARMVPARAHQETLDTTDNHYLVQMCRQVGGLLGRLPEACRRDMASLFRMAERRREAGERKQQILNAGVRMVPRREIEAKVAEWERELKKAEKRLARMEKPELVFGSGKERHDLELIVARSPLNPQPLIWVNCSRVLNATDDILKDPRDGGVPITSVALLPTAWMWARDLQSFDVVRIAGEFSDDRTSAGKCYKRVEVVRGVWLGIKAEEGKKLADKIKEHLKRLETWKSRLESESGHDTVSVPLGDEEKNELRKEIKARLAEAGDLSTNAEKAYVASRQSAQLHARIDVILSRLESSGIPFKACGFPASLTFANNPHYAEAAWQFDRILEQCHLDANVLEKLEELQEFGIMDLPTVYERWVFLVVVRLLIEEFKYVPQDDWIRVLAEVLSSRSPGQLTDHAVTLANPAHQRRVRLIWQPTLRLAGGAVRRPDMAIDIALEPRTPERPPKFHRMYLDAKFKLYRNSVRDGDRALYEKLAPEKDLRELVEKRRYLDKPAEENDHTVRAEAVFVIHPSREAQEFGLAENTPSSLQPWYGHCDYGAGLDILGCESNEHHFPGAGRDHRYGHVCLRPLDPSHLHRLLLYALLDLPEESKTARKHEIDPTGESPKGPDATPDGLHFCPSCSCTSINHRKEPTKGGFKVYADCGKCGAFHVVSYCYLCKRRLWKLDSYWTFHHLDQLETWAIRCPRCQAPPPSRSWESESREEAE